MNTRNQLRLPRTWLQMKLALKTPRSSFKRKQDTWQKTSGCIMPEYICQINSSWGLISLWWVGCKLLYLVYYFINMISGYQRKNLFRYHHWKQRKGGICLQPIGRADLNRDRKGQRLPILSHPRSVSCNLFKDKVYFHLGDAMVRLLVWLWTLADIKIQVCMKKVGLEKLVLKNVK